MVYEIRIMKKITVIISAGDTDKYMEGIHREYK